jgi:reactive intermediate/imine deaminase
MEIIDTPQAPQPKAPIAQAVRSGNWVFVSGTTPFAPDFTLVKGDFEAQLRQTMTNVGAVLAAAGSGFDRVIKCTVILASREDWSKMNGIYAEYFPPGRYPARTAFQAPAPASRLPGGSRVRRGSRLTTLVRYADSRTSFLMR